jgi:zinc transport system substrate-binding protein
VRALQLIAAVVAVAFAGCGGSETSSAEKVRVVTSFYPLEFAAEQVGGPGVSVTNLTPPGAEPHDVELTARDVERIQDADVVLYLGAGFQTAVEDAVEGATGRAVDLLQGIQLREAMHEGELERDPHVWLDPVLYTRIVRTIGRTLESGDRPKQLAARLEQLDAEFERGLTDCRRRELVTSHEAFGYLAARYGLEEVAIAGISPEAEPTPRELEGIVDRVRESGATTVFFETLVSPRVAAVVAREAGVRTAVLNPIEGLTPDEAEAGEDYFSLMRANLAALRRALECR